ncbi:serine/tyrosine/threonine adenylyltransferase [uncultured Thiomicrorhabdus sp.]
MNAFPDWQFQNSFHALGEAFYKPFATRIPEEPKLITSNPEALSLLGLKPTDLNNPNLFNLLSGRQTLPTMRPLAQDYAGHQFGKFNPLLGDGRVLMLGEITTQQGNWELSLKGIGRTPLAQNSVDADGFSGISESLHEFDISHQLAKLGVPTMHCLAVVADKQQAYRNHQFEDSAILSRIAPTQIRFGTFELHYFRRDFDALQQLCDYVIKHYYPECQNTELSKPQQYAAFLSTVIKRTARLIAHWQATGFTHGTMNTDNQSIIGITLDLSHAQFNTSFDPSFTTNPADKKHRYAFGNQPIIGLWNCNVLARALSPLIEPHAIRQALLEYEPTYLTYYQKIKLTCPH